jgi:hypothetical protein
MASMRRHLGAEAIRVTVVYGGPSTRQAGLVARNDVDDKPVAVTLKDPTSTDASACRRVGSSLLDWPRWGTGSLTAPIGVVPGGCRVFAWAAACSAHSDNCSVAKSWAIVPRTQRHDHQLFERCANACYRVWRPNTNGHTYQLFVSRGCPPRLDTPGG